MKVLTDISNEPHESMSEEVPWFVLWPDEKYASDNSGYEVVQPPPALDTRTVHFEDTLADRQCTVVPYQQEQQY